VDIPSNISYLLTDNWKKRAPAAAYRQCPCMTRSRWQFVFQLTSPGSPELLWAAEPQVADVITGSY
jgi:hypothetical protein